MDFSSYITFEDFEGLLRGILAKDESVISKADQIVKRIEKDRARQKLAECDCPLNSCKCYLPIELDPFLIQPGDTITQFIPAYGKEIRLHVLGVRAYCARDLLDEHSMAEVCTAGWPATIVRCRDGVKLHAKGKGITKEELRHRRRSFGDCWDDGY